MRYQVSGIKTSGFPSSTHPAGSPYRLGWLTSAVRGERIASEPLIPPNPQVGNPAVLIPDTQYLILQVSITIAVTAQTTNIRGMSALRAQTYSSGADRAARESGTPIKGIAVIPAIPTTRKPSRPL